MTQARLIAALQEECRTERRKIEDFLNALSDLVAETLERGEQVYVPGLGRFGLRPYMSRRAGSKEQGAKKKTKMTAAFWASEQLRARLKLVEPPEKRGPGLCENGDGRKRHMVVHKTCRACIEAKTRGKREG